MQVVCVLVALWVAAESARLPYIIGGYYAEDGQYPWVGSMSPRGKGHNCGASLISPRWALTAAHCIMVSQPYITFGHHDRSDVQLGYPGQYRAKRVVIHPNRALAIKPNDIALVEFDTDVELTPSIQPITLSEADYRSHPAIITGWGKVEFADTKGSALLKAAAVQIYDDAYCSFYFPKSYTAGMVCLGDKGRSGPCVGDSGGPAVVKEAGQWLLVGVASFVAGDCSIDLPSVYTEVAYFRHWIRDVSGI